MKDDRSSKEKGSIDQIKAIELNKYNFDAIWPYMRKKIRSANVIAIDLELTGLGFSQDFRDKDINRRYSNLRTTASTRSIISLGVATYKFLDRNLDKRVLKFEANVFNVLTMCSDAFSVEPDSMEFLVDYSFDFNRLFKDGIRYERAPGQEGCRLRKLIREILISPSTLCFHNGFIDLAFIYHHFYLPLPEDFVTYCNNVAELFPADFLPVCDSKFLAVNQTGIDMSFLEYVFRFCLGENVIERRNARFYIDIDFGNNLKPAVQAAIDLVDCSLPVDFPQHKRFPDHHQNILCRSFMMYGNCKKKRETCTFLHSIDFALDVHRTRQEKIREKRRKRNRKGEVVTEVKKEEEPRVYFQELTSEIISAMNEELKLKKTGCHRAGVDAFMTGFAVLFQQRMDIIRTDSMNPEFLNRLPLFGKDHPMTFRKSLSKPDCSPDHVAEFAKIQADRQKVLAKQRK